MAEDLRFPAELLDDGFFHGFFVDGDDKVRDLLNEAELRRWSQNQARNPSPFLAHRQLQAARIRHLKQQQQQQQQLLQHQLWLERQWNAKGGGGGGHCPRFSPSRLTPFLVRHQPLPASGMTAAVFLSSSGARKEPTGTGVFLPRTSNSKPQPQKKSDSFMGRRANPVRRSPQPGGAAAAIRTPMSCLPQEWTY